MPDIVTAFAIVAMVLTISALASGLVDRGPISFPMIFLGLGALLGPVGLGFVYTDVHDPALEAVAILTLSLVLFLDAVRLELGTGPRGWIVPVLVLGPGTILTAGLVAGAAYLLLNLSPVYALMLGVILSSTDPVVLRDILRDERIPASVRRVLRVEAGSNDVIVLPILLVLIALAVGRASTPADWVEFLARILLLGPAVGALIGGFGAWIMGRLDARLSVRQEYQALYGIGLVLAAYSTGVWVGGDGFLAAFAAGFIIGATNVQLCDCFLEYGDVTSEMAMLLAFILFGAVLSTLAATYVTPATLLFAFVTLVLARPLALATVLRVIPSSTAAKAFIAWFGPRGLNSLLFSILLIHEGVPGAEQLLGFAGTVVVISVLVHGASATPVAAMYARLVSRRTLPEEREAKPGDLLQKAPVEVERISAEGLAEALAGNDPPIVLDVRSRSEYERDPEQVPGSIRVLPDHVAEWASTAQRDRPVVAYCG